MMPASTSPVPAVASQGVDGPTVCVRPDGAATTVVDPLRSTTTPSASLRRAAASLSASILGETPRSSGQSAGSVPKSSPRHSDRNSPRCGVAITGAVGRPATSSSSAPASTTTGVDDARNRRSSSVSAKLR